MAIAQRHRSLHAAYEDYLFLRWTMAEEATQGYMVTPAAAARGVRGADLYIAGQGRVSMAHASAELLRAIELGLCPGPLSFATFQALNLNDQPPDDDAEQTPEQLLDLHAVARRIKVTYRTIRAYRSRPGCMPAPDFVLGVSPGWRESTIDRWIQTRSGRKDLLG